MDDLNRVEAENISSAQIKYLRRSHKDISTWFCYPMLKEIHRFMFGKVWTWAGKIRKSQTSIGVKPNLIPSKLAELCEEVKAWSTEEIELTFLEKSARIHHGLVKIHPFENGNGRFSRLIADRYLLCWKCTYPLWPDNLHLKGTIRKKYIETLQEADKGNYDPLIIFMKEFGACDPNLSIFFQDPFYKSYLGDTKGIAKVRALLRNGANSNSISKNGHHCLHLIIKAKLTRKLKLEFLKLIIERGADVNYVDKSGLTPFQTAITIEDKEMALFLMSKGARQIAPPGIGYSKYYKLFLKLPPQ